MPLTTHPTHCPNILAGHPGNEPPAGFVAEVDAALDEIAQGPAGRRLLADIAAQQGAGKEVVILIPSRPGNASRTLPMLTAVQVGRAHGVSADYWNQGHQKAARALCTRRFLGIGKAQGTSAAVEWNPDDAVVLDAKGRPTGRNGPAGENYLVLAHELIHALKMQKGTSNVGCGGRATPFSRAGREELRVVGTRWFSRHAVTENAIRAEHGRPTREQYRTAR